MGTEGGPTISRHFNNGKAGCLEATIKVGIDVTVFRLWVYENRYQLLALQGTVVLVVEHTYILHNYYICLGAAQN